MPPLIFLASRLASFRYSKDRGLIPLLSEATAKSLAVARSEQHVPSHLARASTSSATRCQPPSNSVFSSATSLKRNDSPRNAASTVPPPELSELKSSTTSPDRRSASNTDLTSSLQPPSRASIMCPSSLRIAAGPSSILQANSYPPGMGMTKSHVRLLSLDWPPSSGRSETKKFARDPQTPCSINTAAPNPSQITSSAIDSLADLEFVHNQPITDLTPPEAHASVHTSTLSARIIDCISDSHCHPGGLITPNSTDTPAHPPVNEIIIVADESLSTSFLADPTATSTTDTTSNLTPPLSSTSPTDPKATTPAMILSTPQTEDVEVVSVGGIKILDDDDSPPELQQAPEFLEYYDNEGNCFTLPNNYETEKKKKKKKKKKRTTASGSNPSLPSPPVDVQTATVGALSIMTEEELDALERKNDPRYRPIEDSEFIGFDECNDNPTSTPDNPILFYV
ncbi:hypothetical protein MJO28_009826 [Puccinia striiformis f. sp. tritici]|uniref:Uncharacterized protein n=1 Tax=Puccinia striiformis f. sp. tritici TaxID=168172 RepID=A0ACC0E8L5_9BASI|nr:hypothetical protein MJO28_009826 [Puccinia striiformis f. sp. tritici]